MYIHIGLILKRAGTSYPFDTSEVTSGFCKVLVVQSLVFCEVFCWLLLVF